MTGIVLAGGQATRLPLKPLLPLWNGNPAVTSSIDLFKRSKEVKRVVVVVPPSSVLPDVLERYYQDELEYVTQYEPTGFPAAIRAAADRLWRLHPSDPIVVSPCDNAYPEAYCLPDAFRAARVVSTMILAGWQRQYLARWSGGEDYDAGGRWCEQEGTNECFAGWLYCSRVEDMLDIEPKEDTITFLNRFKFKPFMQDIPMGGWYDIGTVDTYARYWRARCG